MPRTKNAYPRDEFDVPTPDAPVGVHRTPPPWWKAWIPFVAVILVAAVVATAGALWLSRGFDPEGEPTPGPGANEDVNGENGAEPTPEPTPDPDPCEWDSALTADDPNCFEPEPVIQLDAPVTVWNGAGIQGLAGQTRDELLGVDLTNVTADTWAGGADPAVNSVWYTDGYGDTARRIASVLGIDEANVEPRELDSDGIYVVLRTRP